MGRWTRKSNRYSISFTGLLTFLIYIIFFTFPYISTFSSTTYTPYQFKEYLEEPTSSNKDAYIKNRWRSLLADWSANWNLNLNQKNKSIQDFKNYLYSSSRTMDQAYQFLIENNKLGLKKISSIFKWYKEKNNLSNEELLALIICYIQDIPYEIPELHYGLYPPMDVLYRNAGDCDSKSLLALALLRNFGFDCKILISDRYRHAMLGLHTVSTGKSLNLRGKPYFFVEMTYPGHAIGDLGRGIDDLNYWKIVDL